MLAQPLVGLRRNRAMQRHEKPEIGAMVGENAIEQRPKSRQVRGVADDDEGTGVHGDGTWFSGKERDAAFHSAMSGDFSRSSTGDSLIRVRLTSAT